MQYFVWLAMMLCVAGCATPVAENPAEPDPVVEEPQQPESSEIEMVELDLAAQDTTFLNEIDGVGGAEAIHTYTVITDQNGIDWQGIAFRGEQEGYLLKPIQGGGAMAARIDGPPDGALEMLSQEALSQLSVDQTAAPPDAEITFVRATLSGDTWTFSVAVDHPDTGWEDYTDGWHVETSDGEILTTRILIHPHVGERPFTRSSSGFSIPTDVTTVYVRSHDLISGYSTDPLAIPVAEAGSGDRYEVVRD